ncbi:hypothetical protein LC593_11985 [Nostoc sp. CHAB 5844]|nr:hypothetical protein [Nostoc sp. CHAB 5844]
MNSTQYKFIPWMRAGTTTLIPTSQNNPASHFQTSVTLQINQDQASVPVHLLGPGDVGSIQSSQIFRREPTPNSQGVEPNYFALIEFREADFPWRFTPLAANRDVSVLPWLTLIALEQRPGVTLRKLSRTALPSIIAPLNELPQLTEAGLWSHVQLSGPFPSGFDPNNEAMVRQYVRDNPQRAIARLLCPRRFAPQTTYLLCLVPTFAVGRVVGLGEAYDVEADPRNLKLQLAWQYAPTSTDSIELPVYYSWTFTTGQATDSTQEFETIARALKANSLSGEVSQHTFAVDPMLSPSVKLPITGVLRPVGAAASATIPTEISSALLNWINQEEKNVDNPQVVPPLYGRWQTGQRQLGIATTPKWLSQLNLDPRHRIAAALGGDIVQKYQDEFISTAWRQVGQLQAANSLVQGAQVAQSLGQSLIQKHIASLPADMLLQVAGLDQRRIQYGGSTLSKAAETSRVPPASFTGAFRRVSRLRGPIMRRWGIGSTSDTNEILFAQEFGDTYRGVNATDAQKYPDWQWKRLLDTPVYSVNGQATQWTIDTTSSFFIRLRCPAFEFSDDVAARGTMFILENAAVNSYNLGDFNFTANMRSEEDDGVGIIFRYRNNQNYYRFSMYRKHNYRRLVKCTEGNFTTLWQDNFSYNIGETYSVSISAIGDRLSLSFGSPGKRSQLVTIDDKQTASNQPHLRGTVGLYVQGNKAVDFSSLILSTQQGINSADLSSRVHDQGDIATPSQWSSDASNIYQKSDIHQNPLGRESIEKLGTYLTVLADGDSRANWTNYSFDVTLSSTDDDAMGVMFRYTNSQNYYRFSMDSERSYQRLVKCVNGQFTLLWQRDEGYEVGKDYFLRIIVDGTRLRGYLKKSSTGHYEKLFELRDRSQLQGQIAFYSWGNGGNNGITFAKPQVKALDHQSAIAHLNTRKTPASPLNLTEVKQTFLAAANSQTSVSSHTSDRLQGGSSASTDQTSATPVYPGVELNIPLCNRLKDLAPEFFLPGISTIPENSVTLLETNEAFIASFLVGANHEMSRELLWRGLSADIGATVFRHFWDVRGGQYTQPTPDINPIHTWPSQQFLENQINPSANNSTVFVLRTELLRRFPQANIYMVEAVEVLVNNIKKRKPSTNTKQYQFWGQLADDILYFGFDITPAVAKGSSTTRGWYLVIEQPESAVRFGLSAANNSTSIADWSDLAWNHINPGAYISTNQLNLVNRPGTFTWGKNSAHMAAIAQRKPFRLFIHASRLLK